MIRLYDITKCAFDHFQTVCPVDEAIKEKYWTRTVLTYISLPAINEATNTGILHRYLKHRVLLVAWRLLK